MSVHMNGSHIRGSPLSPGHKKFANAGGPMRRSELDTERLRQPPLIGHDSNLAHTRPGHLMPAPPLPPLLPGVDDPRPIALTPHGHASRDPMQQPTRRVRGLDDVHGLGPEVERPVHIADFTSPKQRKQRTEAKIFGDARRITKTDDLILTSSPDDHGPPLRLDHLDLDGLTPGHLHPLHMPSRDPPLTIGPERLDGRRGADHPQPLPVEVLIVGHGVRDRPGDMAGVGEVRDARDAGNGEADDVELGAGQMDLLIDAGVLDEPVGVATDDRVPGDRTRAAHQPAVAAGGTVPVGGEEPHGLDTEPPHDLLAPKLGREPGEENVRGQPDTERSPGLPTPGNKPTLRKLRRPPPTHPKPIP